MIVTTYKGMGDALINPPTYANCDPRDTACVNANEALNTKYNQDLADAQANNNFTQCLSNADNSTSPEQYAATISMCNGQFITQAIPNTPVPNTPVYGGGAAVTPVQQVTATPTPSYAGLSFSFTTNRGNASQLQVGDTWYIKITGAAPNTSVYVNGNHNGVQYTGVVEGTTDGSGNFSSSATVGVSDIGTWGENWYVGAQSVGSIGFSVIASGATPPSQAPAGSIVTPATSGTSVPASNPTGVFDLFGDTSTPINIGSFQIGEYTAIGLVGALVVGFMMLGGRRGRY